MTLWFPNTLSIGHIIKQLKEKCMEISLTTTAEGETKGKDNKRLNNFESMKLKSFYIDKIKAFKIRETVE